jgi:hypothetical protein
MREIYAHFDAFIVCPHCHGDLALRDTSGRRLQAKIMGENQPVSPVTLTIENQLTTFAEHVQELEAAVGRRSDQAAQEFETNEED